MKASMTKAPKQAKSTSRPMASMNPKMPTKHSMTSLTKKN